MAKDGLSQGEIDALLSQSSKTEEEEEGVGSKERIVISYNFRKQKKFNKGQFVLLESIHKRFLRNLEVTLTNLLNTPIIATLAAATELTFGDYTDSIASPTCLYLLRVNRDLGKFLLEIDPNFAFFVIDKILGGSGEEKLSTIRELSLIEEKIMYRVINMLLQDLTRAWERIVTLTTKIEGFYAQSDYVQVISSNESVILISMDIRKADNSIGFLNLCLPSAVIESFFQKYDKTAVEPSRTEDLNSGDKKKIEYQIRRSILPLRVVLGETKILVRELLNMEEGDVILLPTEATDPIDIFIGNLKMYKGWPIRKENYFAIKISEKNQSKLMKK